MIIRTEVGAFHVPDDIYTLTVTTVKRMPNFMAHHAKNIGELFRQNKQSIRGLIPLGQEVTETDLDITTVNYFAVPYSYTEI
jgi:hypothetical protein